MSTNIVEVYSSFLRKMADYKFSMGSEEDRDYIEGTLYGYFISARAEFMQCPKDLSTNKDSSIEDIKANEIFINSKLNNIEVEILSTLMLIEYFKPVMIRNETLEQALGDSDFNIYSQANHINQLKDLYKELKREANVKISRYTFAGDVYEKR